MPSTSKIRRKPPSRARPNRTKAALARPTGKPAELQRKLGNAGAGALLQTLTDRRGPEEATSDASLMVQPKLSVGAPDDVYEREADAAASRISAGQPVGRVSGAPPAGALQSLWQRLLQRQSNDSEEIGALPVQRMCEKCRKEAEQKDSKSNNQAPVQRLCSDCVAQQSGDRAQRLDHEPASQHEAGLERGRAEAAMARTGGGSPLGPSMQRQMEKGFDADFSAVRVHTGSASDEAAQALRARAFTKGADVYLARGESPSDVRLMAHELTHTIHQGAASRNGAGAGADAPDVQRVPDLEDIWNEAEQTASDVSDTVSETATDIGGAVIETASDIGDTVSETTSDISDAVSETGSAIYEAGAEAVDAASGVASDAVDLLATEFGRLAQSIASAVGGTVRITPAGLEVTLPNGCPVDALSFAIPLPKLKKEAMVPVFKLPIATGIFLSGDVGLVASLSPGLKIQLGPLCFSGVRIVINPLSGSFRISGTIDATAAAALQAEARGGLRGALSLEALIPIGGVVVPVSVPLVGLEGGLAGLARGIGAAHLTMSGTLSGRGGAISLRTSGTLQLGLAADLFAGAYGQIDLMGKNLCRIYWQPYEWHGDIAGTIGMGAQLSVVPGAWPSITATIDDPTFDQSPFEDIPLAIKRTGFSDDCVIIDALCAFLKSHKLLPSQNGGVWNWSGPYGPGPQLDGPLEVFQRDPSIPSKALCRGACGPDCKTCTEHPTYIYTDPVTGIVWQYNNFQECNSNEGCRQHDAAFDWAADVKGEVGKGAMVMPWHMAANIECACENLAGNCVAWIAGLPPYDSQMLFADTAEQISSADTRALERVQQYLDLGEPILIVTVLAEAPQEERSFLAADPMAMSLLQEAIGASLWPVAQRILNGAASAKVPSLDAATWFLTDQAIQTGDHAQALRLVLDKLIARRIIDSSLADWSHVARVDQGEGLTTFTLIADPTGAQRARPPAKVEIYTPAFADVGLLFSTIMHEYLHVQQAIAGYAAGEFDALGNQRPEFIARDEVQSYLWEIEHATGSGLINNPAQMRDVGERLEDEYNTMTPALQAQFKDRYDAAQQRVRDVLAGRPQMSIDEARRILRDSSREIQELLRRRPTDPAGIDAKIEAIRRRRSEALIEVALTDNPAIQVVRRGEPGTYRVPTVDADGRVRYLHGGIQVAWHMAPASSSAYTLGGALSAGGNMAVAGTAVQGRVHPFPPDIDFDEDIHVVSATVEEAGRKAARRIINQIRRISGGPVPGRDDLEFRFLITFPSRGRGLRLTLGEVLRGSAYGRLARAISRLGGGNINTFWRGMLADGRFTDVTRVIFVTANRPDGTELIGQSGNADLNLAYLEDPGDIPSTSIGAFAWAMCCDAVRRARGQKWLKAAKRAYNYFSTIGDTAHMAALEPVFESNEARVEQYATVIEGIVHTLITRDMTSPRDRSGIRNPQTRILTVDEARDQVRRVAAAVRTLNGSGGGSNPDAIARDLETLATFLRARNARGHVRQDNALGRDFDRELTAVRELIDSGVEATVSPIIRDVVEPVCPDKDDCKRER
ncbi:DUF4157 domain-containing protein [Ruegeria sp. MALMAid1280]|uniref:eCIS core domain-containing protein n=1 Tax=Ruegeria sp. MALMAid1280 TaxID=3411634 RepID=UPI003BA37DFB